MEGLKQHIHDLADTLQARGAEDLELGLESCAKGEPQADPLWAAVQRLGQTVGFKTLAAHFFPTVRKPSRLVAVERVQEGEGSDKGGGA